MSSFNPCIGVERRCCSECLFYGNSVHPAYNLSCCIFLKSSCSDFSEFMNNCSMRSISSSEYHRDPSLASQYDSLCPCFVSFERVLDKYRLCCINLRDL